MGSYQRKPSSLAERFRPTTLADYVWSDNARLKSFCERVVSEGVCASVLLYGPPGVGKTTLARILGRQHARGGFYEISAATSGIKEMKALLERLASQAGELFQTVPLFFIDEIHRFTRTQQDFLLPLMESGKIVCIGATTEVPSFSLSRSLLSRFIVITLKKHSLASLARILERIAAAHDQAVDSDAQRLLCQRAAGDARILIALIEEIGFPLSAERVQQYFKEALEVVPYDEDLHYQLASAMIKSLRGSDADAALYWTFRIIEGGGDPRFVLRRLMIFASEDIGNADPRALDLAVACANAFERIGLPEGRIPLAQLVTYLAGAPKSNRSYLAMKAAVAAVRACPVAAVPLELRNASHSEAEQAGAGKGYIYPHDQESAYVSGATYLPPELKGRTFYSPSDRGYELRMKERWLWLRGKEKDA